MQYVALVARVVGVVVDCVGNVTITVDFFKRDFPFVVAFNPVERNHWEQSTLQALFLSVDVSAIQLVVTVHQQVAGNLRVGNTQVDWQTVCFSIPVGSTTVLFTSEPFRTDVQA